MGVLRMRGPKPPASDDLHSPASPALAVDHLPALLGPHPRTKSDIARSFDVACLMWVMHGWFPLLLIY
jgi:hypothetical protein